MKAGGLIVTPRMPALPKVRTGHPFTTVADVVADCGAEGCGWHAMGQRADVKKAWDEHYRIFHGTAQVTGVVLLNQPKQ